MKYTIYKTTCTVTGKHYIGKHATTNPHDNYLGSGVYLKRAIEKHGKDAFIKEILHIVNTEEEMDLLEAMLVNCDDAKSMNLAPGGKGGFGYINSSGLNRGANNVMHNPITKEKVMRGMAATRAANKEYYDKIAVDNLKTTWDTNRGKKRPDHAAFMRHVMVERWKDVDYKENMRDDMSGIYRLVSPKNDVVTTNRLGEFCEKHNLPFTTMWTSSLTGKKISKGKAKGWVCQKK